MDIDLPFRYSSHFQAKSMLMMMAQEKRFFYQVRLNSIEVDT